MAFEPSYEPTGPFGAKSIGEVVNTPLAAVASAVAHATATRFARCPLRPRRPCWGVGKEPLYPLFAERETAAHFSTELWAAEDSRWG
ncbi:MAG: hypothetical protein ACLUQW_08665 [Collinsella sp.]